jgi:hypothetical protein
MISPVLLSLAVVGFVMLALQSHVNAITINNNNFFSTMANQVGGFLVSPGYGGLIYEGLHDGHIMALKVFPATNAAATANTTSTTTAGQNSTSGAG